MFSLILEFCFRGGARGPFSPPRLFSSIGKNLSQNIPPSSKRFSDFLDTPNSKTIFFEPTYKEEITKIVANLKEGKSPRS